jgi:tetratricopeptide (TPR) repeat protein
MKPKIFIGSSVEGLNVAYAVQQNLNHDAESTVWDQGIFELSRTTIESLTKAVESSDFGVFVFSPDDLTKMRGKEHNTIRDNVIFEFGLFIGKMGRDRVYFLIPDGVDFHLPTDLLGVNPGKYDPKRTDGSFQAATGAACNQIRQSIKKLPLLITENKENKSDDAGLGKNLPKNDWIDDIIDKDYEAAKSKLQKEIDSGDLTDKLINQCWMAYIEFKKNEVTGLGILQEMAKANAQSPEVIKIIARMFIWDKYYKIAIQILDECLSKNQGNIELIITKVECLNLSGNRDAAIELLSVEDIRENPTIAVSLAEIYEGAGDIDKALECIHLAYSKYPNSQSTLFKYARLLQEKERHKEALYLLNNLAQENPKESLYWGYLSNSCLQLDLFDKAMRFCKIALGLSKEKEPWIIHNIGNMLNNKGFYTDAEEWLNKGLKLEPDSEYAHNRLASVLKSRDEEQKRFSEICKEGLLNINKSGS